MNNPNALISMALVSENAGNPYKMICEYLKYCISAEQSNVMTLSAIKTAVGEEFGLFIPYNIAVQCLTILEKEEFIVQSNHRIKRIGTFDTEEFDRERNIYRETEKSLISALLNYVAKYGIEWSEDYAREQLIKVLDKNGLAYDIFVHGLETKQKKSSSDEYLENIKELLPDEETYETENIEEGPLYNDSLFVGKFIANTLSKNDTQRDYLLRICEGLMLCVGAYQMPSSNAEGAKIVIKNTCFFFDTRLLLRFIGCAGDAAVDAAGELVNLIMTKGGKIYYYPQTLEEMNRAFEEAIHNLTNNTPPYDEEMRIYTSKINNSISVLRAKKASIQNELSRKNIYLRNHEDFTEKDRIKFGFDRTDLQQFMEKHLPWDLRTIENDAFSLWETHMRRSGNYSEYCGTGEKIPVFVTTNARLVGIALEYRNARESTSAIYGWRQNRLPVITDIKLTCRLWVPSEQAERLSLLYLTANAVAAQRPTRRYINAVRNLVIEFEKENPEFSDIPLPSFFEDNITETLLDNTLGKKNKLDIGTFANSLAELSEWKAKEQEKITERVNREKNTIEKKYNQQSEDIIEGFVEKHKNKLGWPGFLFKLILGWPAIITVLFAGLSALATWKTGNWSFILVATLPCIMKALEMLFSSRFIEKCILQKTFPKIDSAIDQYLSRKMRKAEEQYREIIIQRTKQQSSLWNKCREILD